MIVDIDFFSTSPNNQSDISIERVGRVLWPEEFHLFFHFDFVFCLSVSN